MTAGVTHHRMAPCEAPEPIAQDSPSTQMSGDPAHLDVGEGVIVGVRVRVAVRVAVGVSVGVFVGVGVFVAVGLVPVGVREG